MRVQVSSTLPAGRSERRMSPCVRLTTAVREAHDRRTCMHRFTNPPAMAETPPSLQIVKSLIAEASHRHGSTLFFIFQVDQTDKCEVHEQLPDGSASIWPESYTSRHEAENAIYRREFENFLRRPVRLYDSPGYTALGNQFAALERLRYSPSGKTTPVGILAFCPPATEPLRIIVADDHEWIRTILVEVVRQTLPTAEVVATGDGVHALAALRSGGCHFLVTNHSMPHMDGPALIRLARQEAPELPIAMVSTKLGDRSEALTAGANWFLTKEQITEHLPKLLLRYAVTGEMRGGAALSGGPS